MYTCDDSVWSFLYNIELLGKLSDKKVYLINDNIMKINLESKYYDKKNKDFENNAYCYLLMYEGNKKAFYVKTWGDVRGCSYKTYDEMAISVINVIIEDKILKQWETIMEDEISKLKNAGYIVGN